MRSLPDKTKQYLIAVCKLLIVGLAFYFIYSELANNDKLDWIRFQEKFEKNSTWYGITFILFLSVLNRFLEILKWQNLVSVIRRISVGESTKQVLAALTAAIFTPNGLGEYGAKALFFEKSKRKKIVFLNLICNGAQMMLSVVFGFVGLMYFNYYYDVISIQTLALILTIIFGVFLILVLLRKATIKGYSIERLLRKLDQLPRRIHRKNLFLAVLRYLTFSHQYYFLFVAFDVDLPYLLLMSAITSVYFLASSLPTFQFLDFAVKGGVSVFFFGMAGINEWIVVFITMLMWFLNIVLPVVIGSYYVLRFKPEWKH
ncbi:MAG: flippase-like domain-containing protein [Flavobacterium sp.]|nr:flippase-like domain-containing protein [Flavobacterium sp.]